MTELNDKNIFNDLCTIYLFYNRIWDNTIQIETALIRNMLFLVDYN